MSPETKEWSLKFENYRVLVGKQENIDTCLNKIKENLPDDGALYEVVERTQAI